MRHTVGHLFVIALFLGFLTACQQNPKTEEAASIPNTTPSFKTVTTPIPFAGSWISESYLASIMKDKSPRMAQEGSQECFFQLPPNTLTPMTMIYNFHEGISDLVPVLHRQALELWEKQNDTLAKTVYVLTPVTADTLLLGTKKFVKINPATRNGQAAILEEILFKGQYRGDKGSQVEFKANGEVTGLGKYKYYLPVMDYFDEGLQVDQIGLGETDGQWEYFGFKFNKDKLDLYTLKCKAYDSTGSRCVFVGFGDKIFSLRKSQ